MEFREAKRLAAIYEAALVAAQARLDEYPRLPNGLTPDSVKATPDWRVAKAAVDRAFAELRAFNAYKVRRFKRELREERRARRAA